MAQVPSLPSNGQPIDTQYLYDIVNSLISINGEISSVGSSQLQTYNGNPITKNTNNLKFQARTVNIVNSSPVTKNNPSTGQISFNTQYNQTPIVTATLVSRNSSTVKATLTITGVDTSAVYYRVDYENNGTTTLDVNIIAIGA